MSTPETLEVLAARHGASLRWLVALTVLLGMLSAVLITTAINVAIPDIMGVFGIGQDRAHWLATGALAGTSVAMLMQAWLVRRFGARATFVTALVVLAVSLVVAAHAPSELVLIGARVVQGGIFGLLQPMAVFMLISVFPPDRKGQAMGMFGLVAITGPSLGPFMGGVIIEYTNWRYIFYGSLPTTIAALLLGTVFLPQRSLRDRESPGRFDWLSFGLVASAIGGLLLALSSGRRLGWVSNEILTITALSLITGGVFVWRQLRSDNPLVDLRPLAVPQFAATVLLSFVFGAGLFGSVYLIPLFVQTVQGLSPLHAGLLLAPSGLALGLSTPISGYLADRVAARVLIVAGLLLSIASYLWMAGVDVNTSFLAFILWVCLGRVGLALVSPALNVAGVNALPRNKLGQGAGLASFSRQLGGAFGVNLLAMALDWRTVFHGDAFTAMLSASSGAAGLLRGVEDQLARAGVATGQQGAAAMRYLGEMIAAQAYSAAFRDSFMLVAVVYCVALLAALMIGGRKPESAPQPARPAPSEAAQEPRVDAAQA